MRFGRKPWWRAWILGSIAAILPAAPVAVWAGETPSAAHAEEIAISGPVKNARIEIFKKDRRLLLYSGDTLLRRYPVGLGFEPVADKKRQGDGATPEGDYFVCVKNPQSRFYLSLGISYPNVDDALRALDEGAITRQQFEEVESSVRRGVCPPWDTSLGGEIYIHGRGSGSDWTLGCVALDDPPMKELFTAISVGAKVLVKP